MEKGENAGYQHFSPFPTMFSKRFFLTVVKSRDCESKAFSTQSRLLTTLIKKNFENIVGKGENAGKLAFTPFPTMFSILPQTNFKFSVLLILPSAHVFIFDQSKICCLVKN